MEKVMCELNEEKLRKLQQYFKSTKNPTSQDYITGYVQAIEDVIELM